MKHGELELISTWRSYFSSWLQSFLEVIMYCQYIPYYLLLSMDDLAKYRFQVLFFILVPLTIVFPVLDLIMLSKLTSIFLCLYPLTLLSILKKKKPTLYNTWNIAIYWIIYQIWFLHYSPSIFCIAQSHQLQSSPVCYKRGKNYFWDCLVWFITLQMWKLRHREMNWLV